MMAVKLFHGAFSVNMFGGQNIDTQVENGNSKIKINGNNSSITGYCNHTRWRFKR